MSAAGYDPGFYERLQETADPSASVVVPMLLEAAPVTSVLDTGCGAGGWLAGFRAHGVEDVLGLDGPWVREDQLRIPRACFRRTDLAQPIVLGRRFDLALALEVAEHLPPERAAGFVADLVAAAPLVLFSAAIPGQDGVNHLNEQWPDWWASLFAGHGMQALDPFRAALWRDGRVAWWYRQNLLLFATDEAFARWPSLASFGPAGTEPLPLVHPALWARCRRRAEPDLGRWARGFGAALRRSLARLRRG
jgi:SAM-dependent methyltransferase